MGSKEDTQQTIEARCRVFLCGERSMYKIKVGQNV